MSYNVVISADFGAANTGLTVHGKLFGTNGVQVGSTITTGFVEAVSGLYVYVLSCPDSQEGVFVAYDSANTSLRRVAVVAPRETENADVKSSTLATTTALTSLSDKVGTPAGASVSADVAAVKAETASIQSDTNDLQTQIGTAGAGLTAVASAANLATLTAYVDTEVAAIKAKTDNLPADPADASDIAASLTAITGYIDTEVATILAAVDTEIAAIKAKTDNLPATPASTSDIPGTAAIATAVFAVAVETGHDLTTVLRAIYAAIRGRSVANNGDNPTTITYYAPDNSTSRIVHTLTDTERTVA